MFGDTRTITLPPSELWIIDWITCAQGTPETGEKLGQLMGWQDLRERIWRAQLQASIRTRAQILVEKPTISQDDLTRDMSDPKNQVDAVVVLTVPEMHQLLVLIPTTWRWGTGEDAGFSLKCRLADELWGAEEREKYEDKQVVDNLLRSTALSELAVSPSELAVDSPSAPVVLPAPEEGGDHTEIPQAFMEES